MCTLSMVTPGNYDDFNFEQSSLRINVECAFGQLIRGWGFLWCPLEMELRKRSAVVGCCIRLHNYCVDSRIDLDEELYKMNGIIELVSGTSIPAPIVNKDGAPVDHLHRECQYPNYRTSGRAKTRTNTASRDKLEIAIKDKGLKRPYRRK